MTTCPSCGRPVEGGETCPHCGASLTLRIPLRLFRYGSLVVAIGGLIALFFAARGAGTPKIRIGDVGATQNLAYVEIAGTVSQPVSYNPDSQTLSFRVDDGTGAMLVSVFRAEAAALITAGRVPAVGDHVTVRGTLRVREDFTGLTLNLQDALALERPAPAPIAIGAIHSGLALQPIEVTARVTGTREPYAGLTIITLQDATGEIDATFDETTRLLTGALARVAVNDVVRVSGVVTLYQDTPQLTLTSSHNLTVLPPDTLLAAVPAESGALTPIRQVQAGVTATVEGTVTGVSSSSGGFQFVVDDGTGSITLLLPEKIYSDVTHVDGLRAGARVSASGPVAMYQGALEIKPAAASAVTVITPGAPAEDATTIGGLGLEAVGKVVTVSGQITASDSFDHGLRLTVDDGSGSITVLLWDTVLAHVPDADQLNPGQPVRATGLVDQFRGQLELVPAIGFDVQVR